MRAPDVATLDSSSITTAAAVRTPLPTSTPASAIDKPTSDSIQLLVGGIPRPFTQGTILPVVGNVMGQLTLRAAEARFIRNFDLFLYQESPSAPYDNADVQVTGQMPDMAHGEFHLLALPMGEGHYSVELPCGMNGQWEFDVDVATQGKKGTIKLLVEIFE
jgi:hypothetical protein